jgi:AcrR family transcriptional regulator
MVSAIDSEPRSGNSSAPDASDGPDPASSNACAPAARKPGVPSKTGDERDRLLSAATEVLQRSGWWGFKVESVLRQAGLSTRSFYRHFEKKSDLLLALLEYELSGAEIQLRRVTASGTPSDRIRAYVTATIDMAYRADLAKPSSLFASHWRELLPEYPQAIDRWIERLIGPLTDAITEGKAHGEFQSDDPVADARAIFYLVASMTADQAAMGASTPREELEHVVMPFISRAVGLT